MDYSLLRNGSDLSSWFSLCFLCSEARFWAGKMSLVHSRSFQTVKAGCFQKIAGREMEAMEKSENGLKGVEECLLTR